MKRPLTLSFAIAGLGLVCAGAIPDNDHFATRIILYGTSVTTEGNNAAATKEPGEPNPSSLGGKSVWWAWTAPADGTLTLSTAGSSFDTLLSVFTGSALTNLTLVAFNDTETSTSVATLGVTRNTAYQIAVDGALNATGRIALQLTLGPVLSPPSNDNFANRTTLTGIHLDNVTGSNVGATSESGEPFHADALGLKSVWWKWTAPASGGLTLTTQGSGIDTVLAVYTGNAVSSLTFVAANDEDPLSPLGDQSRVTCNVTAGTTYNIAVDAYEGDAGDICLHLDLGTAFPTPANDNFANRLTLVGATVTTTGSNVGASFEPGEPLHLLTLGGKSVWWTWTAPSSSGATLTASGSSVDTVVCVYQGTSFASLAFVAGNDEDYLTTIAGDSAVYFNATAGTTYQIAVDGVDGVSGSFLLALDLGRSDPVSSNDNFVNRILVTGTNTTVSGSNIGATLEAGEPLHCGCYGGKSVWWTWTAPGPGFVTVDTIGSKCDTMLAVYTGNALSHLTEIASDDESGGNYTSLVTFPTKSNVTYQMAVDGYDADAWDIRLRVRFGLASYALTLATNPPGGGKVTATPLPDEAGKYAPGQVVTLSALPAAGFAFSGWTGAAATTNNPLALLMNSNRSITGFFPALYVLPSTLAPFQPQTPASIRTNGFQFLLYGASNFLYALERSTNLTNWTPFRTSQVVSGQPVEIKDDPAGNAPMRFYRARRIP